MFDKRWEKSPRCTWWELCVDNRCEWSWLMAKEVRVQGRPKKRVNIVLIFIWCTETQLQWADNVAVSLLDVQGGDCLLNHNVSIRCHSFWPVVVKIGYCSLKGTKESVVNAWEIQDIKDWSPSVLWCIKIRIENTSRVNLREAGFTLLCYHPTETSLHFCMTVCFMKRLPDM